jgi:hypothetical protein
VEIFALLDRVHGGVTAKTLERSLAQDPDFFCQVIRAVFRSDKEDRKTDIDDATKKIAQNGYRLLHEWAIPPGTNATDDWDPNAFREWLSSVKRTTTETGHFAVAMSQVGNVLTYAPADPSGLWIHKIAAEALNAKDAAEMRAGFTIKLFNRRGAHGFTHGHEEKEIARSLRNKADAVEKETYHRLANSLRELAKSYEQDAEREAARDALAE